MLKEILFNQILFLHADVLSTTFIHRSLHDATMAMIFIEVTSLKPFINAVDW